MKYWVFTEQRLDAALAAFVARQKRDRGMDYSADVLSNEIKNFLDSPEARTHKLQGGASYQPEGKG